MLKFLSVKSIVIPPARTGNERSKRNAVINTAQTNKGILCIVIPETLMLKIVVMKFIAPKRDPSPDKWRLKIAKSTEAPEWLSIPLRGG
nr:hypothetical protein [Escherichia coli]